ncbi:MAG: 2-dehydropantoate 2-reductase [Acidimicrobiia bacterium]|nr:2-dehydropantoate 2-reductase [Acidimicrobiia bacterium]
MRFVILGAGAVGGVIGGRLHQAGYAVTLIARGEHLEMIRSAGLRLDDAGGSTTLAVDSAGHPDEITWHTDDVVLLTTKSQHTEAALAELAAVAPAGLPVICAQNGVANERMALRRFDNVYGMVVMLPALHLEPGVVVAHSAPTTGMLDLGRYPEGVDSVAADVASVLSEATFSSLALADIMGWKYRKLVMNLGNAVQAICGRVASGSEIVQRARDEGERVLEAAGISVIGRAEERDRRGAYLQIHEVDGAPRGGGSSWQSLARRTGTIEADYFNGEIALLGRLHGVPAPVNSLLQRLANQQAARRASPGAISHEELLAMLPGQ